MNKLYIPLSLDTLNNNSREIYSEKCIKSGVSRIFITFISTEYVFNPDSRIKPLLKLEDNIRFFEQKGFEIGVWIGGFGYGAPINSELEKSLESVTKITSFSGKTLPSAFCPEDSRFTENYCSMIKDIAALNPSIILIDDDLCLSVRPGLGCFCKRHQKMISEKVSEDFSEFKDKIFSGGKNKYRDAWQDVTKQTLKDFCLKVRQSIDSVNSTVRAGFCSGYTSWDIEGAHPQELSLILAGKTEPLLRLSGAPYWSGRSINRFPGQWMGEIIEFVRAQEKSIRGKVADIFHEGDCYPRPRYIIPANYIECYDAALVASGGINSFKYMFDYISGPDYENGYVDRHIRNKELYRFISDNFSQKSCHGIQVIEKLEKISDTELNLEDTNEKQIMHLSIGRAGGFLTRHCIPTTYEQSNCAIIFGENAKYIESLPEKVILDAKAARILAEKGYDTGFISSKPAPIPDHEEYRNEKILLYKALQNGYHILEAEECAQVCGHYISDDFRYPSAYTYKSEDTEFLVFAFDANVIERDAVTIISYMKQKQILEFYNEFPHIENVSNVYTLFKKGKNESSVIFINIFEDSLFDFSIKLDREYSKMEIFGAEGTLCGDTVKISSEVAPYGIFAINFKD